MGSWLQSRLGRCRGHLATDAIIVAPVTATWKPAATMFSLYLPPVAVLSIGCMCRHMKIDDVDLAVCEDRVAVV